MDFDLARNFLELHNIKIEKHNKVQVKVVIDETIYWTDFVGLDLLLHAVNKVHAKAFDAGYNYCSTQRL